MPTLDTRTGSTSTLFEQEEAATLRWFEHCVSKARSRPFSEVGALTPVIATILMSRNVDNRAISKQNLEKLRRDILEDRYQFNGETIVISQEGLLNDGQHRCAIVIETGKSIPVVFVFGASRVSRLTLDQGVNRLAGHYLGMLGFVDANHVAAVATMIWQLENIGRLSSTGMEKPTKTQAVDLAKRYSESIRTSLEVTSARGRIFGSRTLLAFSHFAISRHLGSADRADAFIEMLIVGADLESTNPILYCRNRLLKMREERAPMTERAELVFRTWNAHYRRETPRTIPLSGGKLPRLEPISRRQRP